MTKAPNWFEVDKVGLAKLIEKRGKAFVLFELIQNAWDQNVTTVAITLEKIPGSRYAMISVEDDDPDGFKNLSHAFTLFAESVKKGDAEKRGRFNLGEKLVLALCETAEIVSTKGGVRFDDTGRHTLRSRRESGTLFKGKIKMTVEEFDEACAAVSRLLPPPTINTTFNGERLRPRVPATLFEATLPTEIADEEGVIRSRERKTTIKVYPINSGEIASLYEMGIPVVETGDAYHIDIQQKVPVNFDRDNVPPAYLRKLRTLVLNAMHEHLDAEQANAGWVRDALADPNVSEAAVKTAIQQRFGDKVVVYDPSDREANNIAITKGFAVVHGGQMSSAEWDNVRRAGAMLPAGQVTPSPKPFSPDGKPLSIITNLSDDDKRWIACAQRIFDAIIGGSVSIRLTNDMGWGFSACYGNRDMIVNKARLGKVFFTEMGPRQVRLLIHEFGHHFSDNHLDEAYHDALCTLGGKLAVAVAADPTLLKLSD